VVHIRRVFYLLNGSIKTTSYAPDDNVRIPVNILPQMGVDPEYLGMLRAQCFSTDFCCIIYGLVNVSHEREGITENAIMRRAVTPQQAVCVLE